MWDEADDNSAKIYHMKTYVEGLHNIACMASEDGGLFRNEKQIHGDFAALLHPLVLALRKYYDEEF